MNSTETQATEQVTVLVFKDNFAARTFTISMGWISRLGLLLGTFLVITLFSLAIATKYYRAARMGDPSMARQLEKELSDLKISYQALEAKKAAAPVQPALPLPGDSPLPAAASPAAIPLPMVTPTVTVTVTPQAQTTTPSATVSSAASGPALLFSAFPADIKLAPEPAKIPISIDELKTVWRGKTLKVQFAIHYSREDKGSQQGRIIILTRGPDTLLAYPQGVLRKAGSESLLAADQGEYFSVSRFREVKADFGPVQSASTLQDVEIILLNTNGEVMIHQVVHPPAPAVAVPTPRPAKAPKAAAEPAAAEQSATPAAPATDAAKPAEAPQKATQPE